MAQLVCDTDFLLKVVNEPLPSLYAYLQNSDLRFATIPQVVKELRGLALSKKRSVARRAAFALRLVGTKIHVIENRIVENNKMEADLALYECAKNSELDSLVATLDGKLLSRLEKNQLPYLTLRHDKPFERTFGRATYLSTRKK
jgi:rRNA-processing protein FCF1